MVKTRIQTGCVTYWTLSQWSDIARLKSGWEPLGFGEFVPEARAPMCCLRDALTEVMGNGQVLVRPLISKTGFVVVWEQRGADDNQYLPLFSARIPEGQTRPSFSVMTDDTIKVEDAFEKYVGRLTTQQVSAALVKVLNQLGGTRLRPTGGVYWFAGDRVSMWEEVTDAVANAADGGKSVAYLIDHDLDANAIVAVRDALVEEVQSETARIARELSAGDLGERAVESRKREAAALRKKVYEYEQILGVGLQVLRNGLDSIDQSGALAELLLAAGPSAFEQEMAHASIA